MGGRGSGINKQKKGAPKSNKAQNRQSDAAFRNVNLSKEARRAIHDEMHGMNYSYQEILEEAKSIMKDRRGNVWKKRRGK